MLQDLPSPMKTWQESKIYILAPFEKRGEMDQGIVRLASYSLFRVAKGFLLGDPHRNSARIHPGACRRRSTGCSIP